MMDQDNALKLIAVITSIIVLSAGLLVVFTEEEKKKENGEKEEIIIDDRINPLIYQGLTVEILRMRNRGLLEKMTSFGTGWRQCPEYYFVIEVDGEVGDASKVEAAGGVTGSGTFTEWDTMLKECRTNFKVPESEEGKDASNVKITIMELQKTGLFGRNENREEKLSIDLTFDYRTGHWTGDDHLKDDDGYGHVLGQEYELWFNIYESDYDHDKIPFWTEVNLYGMDPMVADGFDDPDGDGIPSWWEWKYGYDPLSWDNHKLLDPDMDGVENIEEYMLSDYFADPFHPDVYVELDFMEKNPNKLFDLDHVIHEESQQMLIERLSEYGISTYFDDGWPDGPINGGGEYLEFVPVIDEIVGGHMARWYKHNFPDERKGVFRYFIMAYNAGVNTASEYNNYDHVIMDSSPKKMFLNRFAFTPKRMRVVVAQGLLHELGHSLGIVPLLHYGVDNMPNGNIQWPDIISDEEWKKINEQYKSVMNYNYMYNVFNRNFFEYSDGSHGEYDYDDESNLYLPTFQMDAAIVESPDVRNIGFSELEWTDKNPDPVYEGWMLDENLTESYVEELSAFRFDIDNAVDYNYRIYVKDDEGSDKKHVRVYTKPVIGPPALWTLIKEGKLNDDGRIEWYSFDEQVTTRMNLIK